MERAKAKAILESILFAMGESVEISRLAHVIEEDVKEIKKYWMKWQRIMRRRIEELH